MRKFNAVIKNYKTYNTNIKLATSLILSYKKKSFRDGTVGVSTDEFGKFWFSTPRGKVLFKTGEKRNSEIRLLNEVICYRLAKNMGIDCAIYQPAQMDNKEKTLGVASFNFLHKGEKIISLSELLGMKALNVHPTMETLLPALKQYDGELEFDFAQISESVYKMSIFDLLTFQSDRHLGNISFIINNNNKAQLSPLYDNEYTFFEICRFSFDPNYNSVYEFVDNFFYGDRAMHVHETKQYSGIKGFNKFASQIVSVAKSNSDYKKILIKMLSKADIKKVYTELESEGFLINEDYREFTTQLFDFAKTSLVKKVKQAFVLDTEQER